MADERAVLGRTIANKYRIESVLGEGGMGVVYEGTHEGTGGKVAVKMLRKEAIGDQEHFDRFELEARVSSRIETGHVIRVYDCGKEAGSPFLVMELLKGKSLAQLITERGPLPERLALKIIAQAALGLGRAHAAGVIHRDIKTDNLFLAEVDDAVVVKVLDFGIAKLRRNIGDGAPTRLTETGRLLGTPLYMSPEQAQGLDSVDHRTDIWSLGVVLFEALTGRPPLHRVQNLGKLIVELCAAPPPLIRRLLPEASPEVEDLLARALMLDPALRFESVDAFRTEILRALGTGHQVSPSELAYERIETPSERGVLSTDRLVLPTTVSKPPPDSRATKIQVKEPRHDGATPRSPERAHDATLPSVGAADSERTQPDGTPVIEAIAAPPLRPLVAHPPVAAAPPSSEIVVPQRSRLPLLALAVAGVVGIVAAGYFAVRSDPPPAGEPTTTSAPVHAPTLAIPPPPDLPPEPTAATPGASSAPVVPVSSARRPVDVAHPGLPSAKPKASAAAIAPPTVDPTPNDPPHAGKFE